MTETDMDRAAALADLLLSGDPGQVRQAAELVPLVPEQLRLQVDAVVCSRVDTLSALVALMSEPDEALRCQGYFALSAAERATERLPSDGQSVMREMMSTARLQLNSGFSSGWLERQIPTFQDLPPVPHLKALWRTTRAALGSEWIELSTDEIPSRFLTIAEEMARERAADRTADDAEVQAAGELARAEEQAAQRADLEAHTRALVVSLLS